jgi:hypothetical protein
MIVARPLKRLPAHHSVQKEALSVTVEVLYFEGCPNHEPAAPIHEIGDGAIIAALTAL